MDVSNNRTEQALAHLRRLYLGQETPPTPGERSRCDLALRNYRALLENGVIDPDEILMLADRGELDAWERALAQRMEQW